MCCVSLHFMLTDVLRCWAGCFCIDDIIIGYRESDEEKDDSQNEASNHGVLY